MRWILPAFLLPALPGLAQTPIADARALPLGTSVTVRGIVLNGSELGGIRYLQDATAGIALFPGTGSQPGFSPQRGADVSATGVLKLFNGLLELDPITSYTVHGTNNPLPAAQVVAPAQLGESHESELVRVNGCTFPDAGSTFSSGTTDFSSNGQGGVIYLRSGHPLVGSAIPTAPVDLVAIVSQYSTATPASGGYQLLLRNSADMPPASGIAITSAVTQHDILPDGLTLRWGTNIPGSSQVAFGFTPSLGSFASTPGTTATHDVALTGLPSASFVHARVFSVADGDTAWSPMGLYATASGIPGHVRAYFNQGVDHTVALTTPAVNLHNAFDDTVRAHIDGAVYTLDYAVYNTSFGGIATALNNALGRGVQVRVITEGSTSNGALDDLNAAIPVLYRTDGQGSGMHNKFLVIDADDPARARTITGSTNMTNQSFFSDANNLVIVHDQSLARCYRSEFEEMWGSTGAMFNTANSRFGTAKTDNTPHLFNVGGTLIECWFSPSDNTTARIADALASADESVEFALFAFTHDGLADAVVTAEQRPGVSVRGLIESDDMDTDLLANLTAGGVLAGPDDMPDYLHHKYAIVDRANASAGPLVITGSHNWSYNAENLNDENTLIVHSATIADHFYQEWSTRWVESAVSVARQATATDALQAWPNPARDRLTVRTGNALTGSGTLLVHDAAGRPVITMASGPGTIAWDLSTEQLAPGVYGILLRDRDQVRRTTFVRE